MDIGTVQEQLVGKYEEIEKQFLGFKKKSEEAISEATKYLTKKVDSDPVVLSEDLMEILASSYTIGQIVADSKSFLVLFNTIHHCPKQSNLTDIDRKRFTEVKTIDINNFLNRVQSIEEKIDKKLTAIQSILKFETARILKERS